MVSNLWKAYFGAMFAVINFQLFSDLNLIGNVPDTDFSWVPHFGYEVLLRVPFSLCRHLTCLRAADPARLPV